MATRTGVLKPAPPYLNSASCAFSVKFTSVSLTSSKLPVIRCRIQPFNHDSNSVKLPVRSLAFLTFAAEGETAEAQTETLEKELESEPVIEENTNCAIYGDSSSESDDAVVEEASSVVLTLLNLYKEALANNDETRNAEVESFLKSIEGEKNDLEKKVAALSKEITTEKVRILTISAEFENFRKRAERERFSLVTNAQGEVVESLLPIIDNFERAKAQIKVVTEREEVISNSYQSIYKQFSEILGSLGGVPVEKPFDPMAGFRVSTKSSLVDGLFEKLYKVYSGFTRIWIRF